MDNFTFYNPTKIYFGKDSITSLDTELKQYGKNVLLVTGCSFADSSGLKKSVVDQLESLGKRVIELDGIKPNPRVESVRAGVKMVRDSSVDFILALGGGSVLDASKAIALASNYSKDPWDLFIKKATTNAILPIGAILTVAATGSEANGNTVISNLASNKKLALYNPSLYPTFSILDPAYSQTLPYYPTVCGVVDIMIHILEQYFHKVENSPIQDGFQESLLKAIMTNGLIVKDDLTNYDARSNLMWGSTLALNGILKAGIRGDFSSHQIEHEISAYYDIAHGEGLSIIFLAWMRKVFPFNVAKFKQFAINVFDVSPTGKDDQQIILEGISHLEKFFQNLNIATRLSEVKIDSKHFQDMAQSVIDRSPAHALVKLTERFVIELLESAL